MYTELDTIKLVQEIRETHGVEVSIRVTANAKVEARKILQGSLTDAYAKLRPYILELKQSDPEGKIIVEVDPVDGKDFVLFKRIYIGFSCLRKGFLSGCRKMFALDGCFLKGEASGMILSAVGKDGNNQMFLIAWEVVESENRGSWQWFIEILQEELNLDDGTGWSVISDQQKGLVDSLMDILPLAEHRKCARHVSANWKLKHKMEGGRAAFWGAVYSCNIPDYKVHIVELKKLQESGDDPNALTARIEQMMLEFGICYYVAIK